MGNYVEFHKVTVGEPDSLITDEHAGLGGSGPQFARRHSSGGAGDVEAEPRADRNAERACESLEGSCTDFVAAVIPAPAQSDMPQWQTFARVRLCWPNLSDVQIATGISSHRGAGGLRWGR